MPARALCQAEEKGPSFCNRLGIGKRRGNAAALLVPVDDLAPSGRPALARYTTQISGAGRPLPARMPTQRTLWRHAIAISAFRHMALHVWTCTLVICCLVMALCITTILTAYIALRNPLRQRSRHGYPSQIASKDKDFRYMATNDLQNELAKDSFKVCSGAADIYAPSHPSKTLSSSACLVRNLSSNRSACSEQVLS